MSPAITECVLILAVSFNAFLAILNGHGLTLNRGSVVVAEMAIYAATIAILMFNADRRMLPWFLLAVFIVVNGLLLSLGNGAFNPKYMRDVLVIPVFIMLGMTYSGSLARPVIILQTIVFGVAVLEAVSPGAYAEIFQILKYYVNTRDFNQNAFWNSESTLFVSATRPGDRFFGFVNLHRVSSIFLEPVSLGNYCVIIAVFLNAYWRKLGIGARIYLAVSTLALLIACDGRLAASSIVIVLMGTAFLRKMSSQWSFLYLPMMVAFSALFAWGSNSEAGRDNFSGRLAGSIATLSQVDFSGLIGFDAQSADFAADSGITYFILTQSLLGVVVIWSAICLLPVGRTLATRVYVHGIAMFVPLNLMVSNSFFSIKVASLMWFCFGHLFLEDPSTEASLSDAEPSPAMRRSALGGGQHEIGLRKA
jgi:putative polymerase